MKTTQLQVIELSGTQSASASFQTNGYDVPLEINSIHVQAICAGIISADSILKLQDSLDGINWNDMVDEAGGVMQITLDAGASSNAFRIQDNYFTAKYIRVVYTKNTNTGGTIILLLALR